MISEGDGFSTPAGSARGRWLLLAGALAGIATAATGILRVAQVELSPATPPTPAPSATPAAERNLEPLPPGAVARVNDRLISRQEFEQVLALEVEAGAPREAATNQRVLDRMIDEELRVQRALELNLHLSDPRVRMDLASAVAEAASAAAEEPPDEAALRAYFEKRRDYFAQRGPLRVRQIWVPIEGGNLGDAFMRAREAAKMLRAAQPFETVREMMGAPEPQPVPDAVLSPADLGELIDPSALTVALTLPPGGVSDPIRTKGGFHVLEVRERQRLENADFATCRADVEAEYWGERMRQTLEAHAAELRRRATIQRIDPAL